MIIKDNHDNRDEIKEDKECDEKKD